MARRPRAAKEYSHALDPFVALGAAAAATSTLKLGTGVCLVIEHDAITLAKEVASVDYVSNGRFLFGSALQRVIEYCRPRAGHRRPHARALRAG